MVTASTTTTVTTSVPIGATSGALTVTLSGLTATSSTNFTVVPPPTITGFNPTAGVIGTPVTISGTNFDAIAVNNIVKFSGTTAVVSSSTTTSISTSVPVGAVNGATGPITVTVGGQTATSATGFTVTTIPAPTITSFNPTSGAIGATVVITGTNFDAVFSNNTVKFNGTTATPTASTTTSITTKVPTGATSGTISVTANGQTVTSTASFTVTTDTTPPTFGTNSTAGSVALGAALAINADFLDAESGVPEGTILYRSVSSTTTTYTEGALTKGTGNAFTGSVPATVIGELGLEYKLKAKNGVGLEAISQVYTVTVVHSSGLTVPINTTFAKSQSSYRIIAVPLVLTTNSISSIFGGALGGYDETVWRMYHYENATMSKLSSSSPMEQGKGYWFLSTKAPTGNFNTGVGSTVSASFDQPFEIPVNPGWNQIGNPYNFNISWTDIRNANPALASKLSATARSYNGSVIEVDKIGKFEGVYVSFTGSTSDKIKIPVAKNPNINGRIASTPLNSLDNQDWTVKFNLSNGLQQYALGGVGMHPQASEGMDPHDDFNIPRFFDYLEVKHPKNFFDMTFTLDVVPTLDQYVWNFTTETNQKSGAITMNWDNSYFGKGSQQLWLMDVETGAVWDMKKETSVTVDYSPVRRWRVAFGSDSFVKDATLPENSTLMAIFPNPFRSEISFEYVVVEPTSVKLEIMDLNGKNVGALVNQNMEKGRYVSKWVANSNGADEPAIGIYIVRFQAGSVVQYKRIMKN